MNARLTAANGHAERIAALSMIEPRADRPRAITLGADKAYHAEDFVNELKSMNGRAHVPQNTNGRRSAIDARTTRRAGYGMSQRIRKRGGGLQPGPSAQAARSAGVSALGRWRIVELPGYDDDYADLVEPAYILFEAARGEFAFGCVTGSFAGGGDHAAVEFDWNGNDEMNEVRGSGWAEPQPDGSMQGEISFHGGDDIPFIARRWPTSSTAC